LIDAVLHKVCTRANRYIQSQMKIMFHNLRNKTNTLEIPYLSNREPLHRTSITMHYDSWKFIAV